mgnify:CR=1 FL=1
MVDIVLKQNQKSGTLTRGVVKDVLSNGDFYRHGVKVRLNMPDVDDVFRVGRVQHILGEYPLYHAQIHTIGLIGDRLLGYRATLEQIQNMMNYKLNIQTRDGISLTWENLHSEKRSSAPLSTILQDRLLRVDEGKPMRDLPRYAVLSVKNRQVIRFEYYQGREKLRLVYDLRREDLYIPWIDEYLNKNLKIRHVLYYKQRK